MNTDSERQRIKQLLTYEKDLWNNGLKFIAGIDEAGRGPLAGPVVAAAVIFPRKIYIPEINDSKKISHQKREHLFPIIKKNAITFGIGIIGEKKIDKINILQATFAAMISAVKKLSIKPQHLLIDGNKKLNIEIQQTNIIKGDSQSFSIAAASILAKVTRDRKMLKYDKLYPEYGFAKHKGYPTKQHITAIKKFGFCPIHRKSFKIRTLTDE